MKKIITILLLVPMFCSAQKQGNIWYFGGSYANQYLMGAGINFNPSAPLALTNSGMTYTEGSATYCNSAGELLFYAQGDTVYDKTHNIMSNGTAIGGHWSTEQSALIVPVTGDTNKYYIFNNDGVSTSNGTGLHYSVIDMQQNSNLGAVTEPKAQNLVGNTSEQLTGCKHSNGTDFWVITTDHDSSILYAFQVTPSGVMSPIITNLGFNNESLGVLEISPNADKLAMKIRVSTQYFRHLIDFNNTTGVFSNPYPIGSPTNYNSACGFSPNGNLFYDLQRTNTSDSLFQYNLSAANIASSKLFIFTRAVKLQVDSKVGPDGKLYFGGNFNSSFLDAINFPNLLGTACNFQPNAISLAGISPGIMLPNELLIANTTPIGIKEIAAENKITVYPNPTNAEIIIKSMQTSFSADDQMQLFSIIGEPLYTSKINSQLTTLNLSSFPQGAYILITSINGIQQSFKILKE